MCSHKSASKEKINKKQKRTIVFKNLTQVCKMSLVLHEECKLYGFSLVPGLIIYFPSGWSGGGVGVRVSTALSSMSICRLVKVLFFHVKFIAI